MNEERTAPAGPPATGSERTADLQAAPEVPAATEAGSTPLLGWSRIMTIVAFALSLALLFGTAAKLQGIPQELPVAWALGLLAGIVQLPTLVLYILGREKACVGQAPWVVVGGTLGILAYSVGGSVAVASPTLLGGGILALVAYANAGHPARESSRRRVRRVRRWSRNAVVIGLLCLVIALVTYTVYTSAAPVTGTSSSSLRETNSLLAGETLSDLTPTSAGSGDVLYLLVGASNASFGVFGSIVNSAGTAVANVTAGPNSQPGTVFLQLRVDPGTYSVRLTYPSSGAAPSELQVRWTFGDIPAELQALTGIVLTAGWGGFALLIVGSIIWWMARPLPEPGSSETSAPGPSGETTPTPETASGEGTVDPKDPAPVEEAPSETSDSSSRASDE